MNQQGKSAWRDRRLGAALRDERRALCVSALELANAAWEIGVPLSCTEVHRIEQAQRHPTPWHLYAWMEVLNLSEARRRQLVAQWAESPRWSSTVTSWETWRQLLAEHDQPVPVTREARSARLRQNDRGFVVGATFKLRLTVSEHGLVRKTARFCDVPVSKLIRDAVFAAIAEQRTITPRDENPSLGGPRTESTNVRLSLGGPDLATFRRLAYGLDFAAWARLIVLEDIETGRCAARYGVGEMTAPPAAPPAPAPVPAPAPA